MAIARPTARPRTTARPRAARDDRELAELAIAGDGEAFAQLYDRHERRVYGYCLRMLGTPDEAGDATQETFVRLLKRLPALEGRDVNFIAYALTTARNACYDAIEARRRMRPAAEPIDQARTELGAPIGRDAGEPGEIALDPERAALLAATREEIRKANARLPERQREVLALRELEQLSYEQIGAVVGMNDNAVAQLISRARIRLRAELRGDALGSIATSSPDCERALPLLARLQDAQTSATDELDWLATHMAGCETCRLGRAAMEEAGASYRALGPIVVLAWLRHATIAHAARFVGADWSHLADSAHPASPTSTQPAGTQPVGARAASDAPRAAAGREDVGGWTRMVTGRMRLVRQTASGGESIGARRLRWAFAVVAALCVILAVVLAGSLAPDSRVLPPPAPRALSSTSAAPAGGRPPAASLLPAHRASHPADPSLVRGSRAIVDAARGGQPGTPAAAVHRTRPMAHGRSTHQRVTSPTTPTAGAPTPSQPATTTPTSTTPAPSPPSSGSGGGSTGSGAGAGPGTSTGNGETPAAPTETPGGSPSGGSETSGGSPGGCALAVAC